MEESGNPKFFCCAVCNRDLSSGLWEILEHPLLAGVALCKSCEADVASLPLSDDFCAWCGRDDCGETLYLCDTDDCGRAFGQGCIAQLGEKEEARVQGASLFHCYCCDGAPLSHLQQRWETFREDPPQLYTVLQLLSTDDGGEGSDAQEEENEASPEQTHRQSLAIARSAVGELFQNELVRTGDVMLSVNSIVERLQGGDMGPVTDTQAIQFQKVMESFLVVLDFERRAENHLEEEELKTAREEAKLELAGGTRLTEYELAQEVDAEMETYENLWSTELTRCHELLGLFQTHFDVMGIDSSGLTYTCKESMETPVEETLEDIRRVQKCTKENQLIADICASADTYNTAVITENSLLMVTTHVVKTHCGAGVEVHIVAKQLADWFMSYFSAGGRVGDLPTSRLEWGPGGVQLTDFAEERLTAMLNNLERAQKQLHDLELLPCLISDVEKAREIGEEEGKLEEKKAKLAMKKVRELEHAEELSTALQEVAHDADGSGSIMASFANTHVEACTEVMDLATVSADPYIREQTAKLLAEESKSGTSRLKVHVEDEASDVKKQKKEVDREKRSLKPPTLRPPVQRRQSSTSGRGRAKDMASGHHPKTTRQPRRPTDNSMDVDDTFIVNDDPPVHEDESIHVDVNISIQAEANGSIHAEVNKSFESDLMHDTADDINMDVDEADALDELDGGSMQSDSDAGIDINDDFIDSQNENEDDTPVDSNTNAAQANNNMHVNVVPSERPPVSISALNAIASKLQSSMAAGGVNENAARAVLHKIAEAGACRSSANTGNTSTTAAPRTAGELVASEFEVGASHAPADTHVDAGEGMDQAEDPGYERVGGGHGSDDEMDDHQAAEDGWICSQCTLRNEMTDTTCGACSADRPAHANQGYTQDGWRCSQCTLRNEMTDTTCGACAADRPAHAEQRHTQDTPAEQQKPEAPHVDADVMEDAPAEQKEPEAPRVDSDIMEGTPAKRNEPEAPHPDSDIMDVDDNASGATSDHTSQADHADAAGGTSGKRGRRKGGGASSAANLDVFNDPKLSDEDRQRLIKHFLKGIAPRDWPAVYSKKEEGVVKLLEECGGDGALALHKFYRERVGCKVTATHSRSRRETHRCLICLRVDATCWLRLRCRFRHCCEKRAGLWVCESTFCTSTATEKLLFETKDLRTLSLKKQKREGEGVGEGSDTSSKSKSEHSEKSETDETGAKAGGSGETSSSRFTPTFVLPNANPNPKPSSKPVSKIPEGAFVVDLVSDDEENNDTSANNAGGGSSHNGGGGGSQHANSASDGGATHKKKRRRSGSDSSGDDNSDTDAQIEDSKETTNKKDKGKGKAMRKIALGDDESTAEEDGSDSDTKTTSKKGGSTEKSGGKNSGKKGSIDKGKGKAPANNSTTKHRSVYDMLVRAKPEVSSQSENSSEESEDSKDHGSKHDADSTCDEWDDKKKKKLGVDMAEEGGGKAEEDEEGGGSDEDSDIEFAWTTGPTRKAVGEIKDSEEVQILTAKEAERMKHILARREKASPMKGKMGALSAKRRKLNSEEDAALLEDEEKAYVLDEGTVEGPEGEQIDPKKVVVRGRVAKHLREHQVEGVQFMYWNLVGTIDDISEEEGHEKEAGFGCILSHCMGLGKTLQVVALTSALVASDTLKEIKKPGGREPKLSTVLVLCPINVLRNWGAEFKKWGVDGKDCVVSTFDMNDLAGLEKRVKCLEKWFGDTNTNGLLNKMDENRKGRVLIMGYEAYRNMVLKALEALSKQTVGPKADTEKELSRKVLKCLRNPGPDVLFADEGHLLKNQGTGTVRALAQIKTRRRCILTGSPLQNNIEEYYTMVNFIRPGYLGPPTEFKKMFVNPITNGFTKNCSISDKELSQGRVHILQQRLKHFVNRKGPEILQKELGQQTELIIGVKLSPAQVALQRKITREAAKTLKGKLKVLEVLSSLTYAWAHPELVETSKAKAAYEKKKAIAKGEKFVVDAEDDAVGVQDDATLDAAMMDLVTLEPASKKRKVSGLPGSREEGDEAHSSDEFEDESSGDDSIIDKTHADDQMHDVWGGEDDDFVPSDGENDKGGGMKKKSAVPRTSSGSDSGIRKSSSSSSASSGNEEAPTLTKNDNVAEKPHAIDIDMEEASVAHTENSKNNTNYASPVRKPAEPTSFMSSVSSVMRSPGNFLSRLIGNSPSRKPQAEGTGGASSGVANLQEKFAQDITSTTVTSATISGTSSTTVSGTTVSTTASTTISATTVSTTVVKAGSGTVDKKTKKGSKGGSSKKRKYDNSDLGPPPPKPSGPVDAQESGKIIVLLEIIAQALTVGDKVCVVSRSVQILDLIERVLSHEWTNFVTTKPPSEGVLAIKPPSEGVLVTKPPAEGVLASSEGGGSSSLVSGGKWGPWRKGRDYLRIDGSTTTSERQARVDEFNRKKSQSKLFMLTTAGAVGINLVAANRVVLMDINWNPAVDLQAMFRCYRYGQGKKVSIYRLLSHNSVEEKLYMKQTQKRALGDMIIDEKEIKAMFTTNELQVELRDENNENSQPLPGEVEFEGGTSTDSAAANPVKDVIGDGFPKMPATERPCNGEKANAPPATQPSTQAPAPEKGPPGPSPGKFGLSTVLKRQRSGLLEETDNIEDNILKYLRAHLPQWVGTVHENKTLLMHDPELKLNPEEVKKQTEVYEQEQMMRQGASSSQAHTHTQNNNNVHYNNDMHAQQP